MGSGKSVAFWITSINLYYGIWCYYRAQARPGNPLPMMPPITPGKARLYQVTRPQLRLYYARQGSPITPGKAALLRQARQPYYARQGKDTGFRPRRRSMVTRGSWCPNYAHVYALIFPCYSVPPPSIATMNRWIHPPLYDTSFCPMKSPIVFIAHRNLP